MTRAFFECAAKLGHGHVEVVSVSTNSAEHEDLPYSDEDAVSLDELARRQGVQPVRSLADMARPDVFESGEEADELVAWVRALRRADVG
jgi:hypothetical protein